MRSKTNQFPPNPDERFLPILRRLCTFHRRVVFAMFYAVLEAFQVPRNDLAGQAEMKSLFAYLREKPSVREKRGSQRGQLHLKFTDL